MNREEAKILYLDNFFEPDIHPHDVYALVDKIYDVMEAENKELKNRVDILRSIVKEKDQLAYKIKLVNDLEIELLESENKELKDIRNSMVLIGSDIYEDNFVKETTETYKVIISKQKK